MRSRAFFLTLTRAADSLLHQAFCERKIVHLVA